MNEILRVSTILAVAILLAPGSAASSAGASSGEGEEIVCEVLGRVLGDEGVAEDADLASARHSLGRARREVIPVLFDALAEGALPSCGGAPAGPLPPSLEDVVLGGLAAQPLALLREHLEPIASADAPEEARIAGIRVLGAAGGPLEIELLLRLASPSPEGPEEIAEPAEPRQHSVPVARRNAFEQALGGLLERDASAAWVLRDRFGGIDAALLAPVVRSVGRLESQEAIHVLSSLVTTVHDADSVVLAEITRLGNVVPHPIDDYALTSVRRQLASTDQLLVRHAILAAGSLEDYDAIPSLIDVLGTDDPTLRESARGALVRISGRDFRTNVVAWEQWYRRESTWWSREVNSSMDRLRSQDPAVALRGALDLGSHRIHRHDLAAYLAQGLGRSEPEIVKVVCSSLAQLGSPVAVPELVRVLDRREPEVREAAWIALRTITGRDLPLDPAAWREWNS